MYSEQIYLAVPKLKSREKGSHVQTASTHFGAKICPASSVVPLVFVPDELHHKFTGLLRRKFKYWVNDPACETQPSRTDPLLKKIKSFEIKCLSRRLKA